MRICDFSQNDAPACTSVGVYGRERWTLGVGWCACDKDKHHVHAHLVGLGGVGWVICTVVRTLSDLWGGVNGHGMNLRDQCGVCDNVTV